MTPTRLRPAAAIAAGTLLALTLSACGSSTDTASSDAAAGAPVDQAVIDAATAAVKAAREPITDFTAPSAPAGPIPTGELVSIVTALNAAPLPYDVGMISKAAFESLGLKADVLDGQGSPAGWDKAVRTALNANAKAIVMSAAEPSLVPEAAQAAAAQDVPFTTVFGCETPKPDGVSMEVPETREAEGKLLADWVMADSPEGAEVIVQTNAQFFCLAGEVEAFKAELAKGGAAFKVVEETEATPADQAGTAAVQKVAGLLRKHPDAHYFFTMQADWAPAFVQGLKSVGRDDVTGLFADSKWVIDLMRENPNLVAAGPNIEATAWIGVYATIAAMNGLEVPPMAAPVQLIDSENIGTDGDPTEPQYDLAGSWTSFLESGN
ncbi:sugar ABC transporter substrate-binding protein [Nocardioides sp. KIGAM211]|uniref:Sugar ABC transporter substrate-binding protein n=1 Tax=Nocardioides luti TaxID=2761101 RepID=A0A7X0RGD3_9ACTN|nr:substrate-binding domain-containing protein [Nocardioides luti]MBB6627801.1 sugar ABC transporter substrate-binding protein [Nocardioides luti]